jgi:hypothetical protein
MHLLASLMGRGFYHARRCVNYDPRGTRAKKKPGRLAATTVEPPGAAISGLARPPRAAPSVTDGKRRCG